MTIDGGEEQCGCVTSYKGKWSETPRFLDGGVSLVRGTWAFGP